MKHSEKMASVEKDLRTMVTELNDDGNYRMAQQVQGLLQAVGGVAQQMADQNAQPKTKR